MLLDIYKQVVKVACTVRRYSKQRKCWQNVTAPCPCCSKPGKLIEQEVWVLVAKLHACALAPQHLQPLSLMHRPYSYLMVVFNSRFHGFGT